ncbi:MAG: mandelate racemase/muconate lactonizing enzyme family protein [Candidatus Bathyarchaeia archaeon]
MKITKIESFVLLAPDYDSEIASSAQEDIVVKVHTDAGIVGIGETDTNSWAAKAYIHSPGTHNMSLSLEPLLLGEDPIETEALWDKMYVSTAMTGRRGLGICAIGALDIALWDIKGKALKKPVWELLGGKVQSQIHPYASLLPNGRTLKELTDSLIEKVLQAKNLGFTAAKLEILIKGPYSQAGLQEEDSEIVKIVERCRDAVGSEMTLMLDVGYCWGDWKIALKTLKDLEPFDLYFVETPLRSDDLDGYASLADNTSTSIAAGEWLQTRYEFQDLIDRGHIDIAQPDIGRVGGITEAKRVAEYAAIRNRRIIPHCWKTGIGIAASVHLAAASPNASFIEFLPSELSESPIRRELVRDEFRLEHGRIPLPSKPGLGIELNEDAVEEYKVA